MHIGGTDQQTRSSSRLTTETDESMNRAVRCGLQPGRQPHRTSLSGTGRMMLLLSEPSCNSVQKHWPACSRLQSEQTGLDFGGSSFGLAAKLGRVVTSGDGQSS